MSKNLLSVVKDETAYLREEVQALKLLLCALIISKHDGQVTIPRSVIMQLETKNCTKNCTMSYSENQKGELTISVSKEPCQPIKGE